MSQANSGNATWIDKDCVQLLEHLVENKAAAGDSANFKAPTFRGAATALEAIRTKGGPKSWKSCQNKYTSVSVVFFYLSSYTL
jgi:hypothetical protein